MSVSNGWNADIASPPRSCLPPTMSGTVKRVRRREGDILRIELGGGRHSYAQVGVDPLIIFFDGAYSTDQPLDAVCRAPVLFRLWVMKYAVTKGIWPVVGQQPLSHEDRREPFFYKQDVMSGRLYLHHSSFADANYERASSLSECRGLECAAVWDPEHVVDRLNDHYAGRPNSWVESLQIEVERLPAN